MMMNSASFIRQAKTSYPIFLRTFSSKNPFQNVGIVGLGLMGHGIAQTAASAGCNVICVETQQKALDSGRTRIEKSLEKIVSKSVSKGTLSESEGKQQLEGTLGRIQYNLQLDALQNCDIIVEAIIEDINVKVPFYQNLGKITHENTIFASNTSSLPITAFAEASGRPNKFVGVHFFNPVQLMKLVEVVSTKYTDTQVFEATKQWVKYIGKVPVSCGDTPGFIVNRLLVPAMAQAMLMVDRGDATVEDIDISMQLGAGHPMGPLTLADYVGLDTCLSILQGWVERFPNEPAFVVPECLKEKVKKGKFGRKNGVGFYRWEGDTKVGIATD